MFDFRQACDTMIRQQFRTTGVLNDELLQLVRETPRQGFVPAEFQEFAYADVIVPLAHGQQMLRPVIEAQILQAASIEPTDEVLEIGTGTGYFTALLSQLAKHVTTIEVYQDLLDSAKQNPWFHKHQNITWHCAEASRGPVDPNATYDVIIISGGLYALPASYLDALRPGGRLIAIIGTNNIMEVRLYTKEEEVIQQKRLFETVTPYLLNAQPLEKFKF